MQALRKEKEKVKSWRDFSWSEWPDILTLADPDWTDHFMDAELGLEFYDISPDKNGDTITQLAVREYMESLVDQPTYGWLIGELPDN